MNGLRDAVTLLTRVPVGARRLDDARMARAVPWFPVVGAGVGLVVAGVYGGLLYVLPPVVASALAIVSGVALTGAFHEDGLGDVADAFGGGADREDRLRILKDPRLGTYGVIAIVASLLLRTGSVAALDRHAALLALPAAHALSRAAAVGALAVFEPPGEGLGESFGRGLRLPQAIAGVAAGIVIAAALVHVVAAPGLLLSVVVAASLGLLARRKIGGVNGDVLGAIQQVSEISLLLLFVALHARLPA